MEPLKLHWKFIKEFKYWNYFKEQTWYFFHPIHNLNRAYQFAKDSDEEKLESYYDRYKKMMADAKRKEK